MIAIMTIIILLTGIVQHTLCTINAQDVFIRNGYPGYAIKHCYVCN